MNQKATLAGLILSLVFSSASQGQIQPAEGGVTEARYHCYRVGDTTECVQISLAQPGDPTVQDLAAAVVIPPPTKSKTISRGNAQLTEGHQTANCHITGYDGYGGVYISCGR